MRRRRGGLAGGRRAFLASAVAIAAAGCFAYRPAEPRAVRAGEVVRVDITPVGAERLTRDVGPRVESLGGRVVSPQDSALVVAVSLLTRSRGAEELWSGQSVVVPVASVGALSVRRLDRYRTLLAFAGTTVGILVARRMVEEAGIFGSAAGRQPGSQ